ncbi:hypothetical protein ABZ605_28280 [Streptomyces sp. NPDC012765]|uniref:hypothetical protein n=1 Tax=Streptomyces sp. NPDC012765 TaxID=3155249 RepID=UPI0033C46925
MRDEPVLLKVLPPAPGNRQHYRARLAASVLDKAPGRPMWSTGSNPKNIVALHHHAGRCDQSAKRIREHAELNAQWTSRLEAVGFTVRPARRCGIIATGELPATDAVATSYGPAEDFTDKVVFPAYGVGGLVRLEPTYASANYAVLTPDETFICMVKEIRWAVDALAVHFGLPDDDIRITHAPTPRT